MTGRADARPAALNGRGGADTGRPRAWASRSVVLRDDGREGAAERAIRERLERELARERARGRL